MGHLLRSWPAIAWLTLFVAIHLAVAPAALAQEEVGGPYEPDENTVVLLHFDGDLVNQSDLVEDGEGHGNISYFDASADESLGSSLRLDNDATSDSSYVTIPDAEALDMTGSWTIEGWINVFTFGETSDDWRWVPRMIIKPGDEDFWRPNYFIEMWGSDRFFSSGYHAATGATWPQANTPVNTVQPGNWYHIAFVRDTTEHVVVQLVHDAERNLVAFASSSYDPIEDDPPLVNEQPLHIGWAGGGSTDSWLDGWVDEIRISNVVRDFDIPPIMRELTELENQPVDAGGYEITAEAFELGAGTISEVVLHYNTGTGWQELPMSSTGDRTYAATIPTQALGTQIQYYVSATDDSGQRATLPSNVEEEESYPSFGVFEPDTQTLDLDFEAGSGTPVDSSQYAHEVEIVGEVAYSDDAAEGDYSLELLGDSSYLQIESPFLASQEMTVELWFNADSIETEQRLIGKESIGSWWEQNFEMKFTSGNRLAAGSYFPESAYFLIDDLVVEDSLSTGTWYHAQYVLSADSALLRIENIDGELVGEARMAVEGTPTIPNGPFRLGHSGPDAQEYFNGRFDDVRVYNYAKNVFSTDVERPDELPRQLTLEQNYPNPFNPTTTISYRLPEAAHVTLTVFDMLGRKVATLIDGEQVPGTHEVQFDARSLSSGVYFYQIRTPEATRIRSMMLVK